MQKCYGAQLVFHQKNYAQLYQCTQLEVTPNFNSVCSMPCASKIRVNLLGQKSLIERCWIWHECWRIWHSRTFNFSGQHMSEERFTLGLPEDILRLQFVDEAVYLAILWSGDTDLEDTRLLKMQRDPGFGFGIAQLEQSVRFVKSQNLCMNCIGFYKVDQASVIFNFDVVFLINLLHHSFFLWLLWLSCVLYPWDVWWFS